MVARIVNAVRVADRLYEMRDTARSLYGDGYEGRIAWAREALERYASAVDCTTMEACTALMKHASDEHAPVAMLHIGAAAVEMIEEM